VHGLRVPADGDTEVLTLFTPVPFSSRPLALVGVAAAAGVFATPRQGMDVALTHLPTEPVPRSRRGAHHGHQGTDS
jgi:hypothetical protein